MLLLQRVDSCSAPISDLHQERKVGLEMNLRVHCGVVPAGMLELVSYIVPAKALFAVEEHFFPYQWLLRDFCDRCSCLQ